VDELDVPYTLCEEEMNATL